MKHLAVASQKNRKDILKSTHNLLFVWNSVIYIYYCIYNYNIIFKDNQVIQKKTYVIIIYHSITFSDSPYVISIRFTQISIIHLAKLYYFTNLDFFESFGDFPYYSPPPFGGPKLWWCDFGRKLIWPLKAPSGTQTWMCCCTDSLLICIMEVQASSTGKVNISTSQGGRVEGGSENLPRRFSVHCTLEN